MIKCPNNKYEQFKFFLVLYFLFLVIYIVDLDIHYEVSFFSVKIVKFDEYNQIQYSIFNITLYLILANFFYKINLIYIHSIYIENVNFKYLVL